MVEVVVHAQEFEEADSPFVNLSLNGESTTATWEGS